MRGKRKKKEQNCTLEYLNCLEFEFHSRKKKKSLFVENKFAYVDGKDRCYYECQMEKRE